jgi:hypothetical protein
MQLQVLTGSGGQELLTFTSNTEFASDLEPGVRGSFIYTPNGNTASLALDYNAPSPYQYDFYDLTLTFTTAAGGVFSGNMHYEGVDHEVTGNFAVPQ